MADPLLGCDLPAPHAWMPGIPIARNGRTRSSQVGGLSPRSVLANCVSANSHRELYKEKAMFSTSKEETYQDLTVKASLSGVDVTLGDFQRKGMSFKDFVAMIYPAIVAAAKAEKGESK